MKILYVEDEVAMARAVAQVLKKNNYRVDLAHDGVTYVSYLNTAGKRQAPV